MRAPANAPPHSCGAGGASPCPRLSPGRRPLAARPPGRQPPGEGAATKSHRAYRGLREDGREQGWTAAVRLLGGGRRSPRQRRRPDRPLRAAAPPLPRQRPCAGSRARLGGGREGTAPPRGRARGPHHRPPPMTSSTTGTRVMTSAAARPGQGMADPARRAAGTWRGPGSWYSHGDAPAPPRDLTAWALLDADLAILGRPGHIRPLPRRGTGGVRRSRRAGLADRARGGHGGAACARAPVRYRRRAPAVGGRGPGPASPASWNCYGLLLG